MKIKQKCMTPEWIAAGSALAVGIVTHFFFLVNVLHNYDDIGNLPGGYGAGVSSGRWFLELLGLGFNAFGLNYNLPVLNGLCFLLLMALTAGVLVAVLKLRSKCSAALLGMLITVFPTACSMLFFRFTAGFYAFSCLLAVCAPWLMERRRHGWILAVGLLVLSLGIYQSHIPFAIGIFVLLLIRRVLEGECSPGKLIGRGLQYCAVLLLSFAIYYVMSRVFTMLWGERLNSYRGIESMGVLDLKQLPRMIVDAVKHVYLLPFRDYGGIAYRRLLRLVYLLLTAVTVPLVLFALVTRVKKPLLGLMLCLLLAVFPLAVNFIEIMVPEGGIYTLMLYPLVLLVCLPLVVMETLADGKGKPLFTAAVSLTVALLVFCYSYFDNVNYTAHYFINRQIENYVSSMVVQVRMTEGFETDMEWALLGSIDDPLLQSQWDEEAAYGGIGSAQYIMNHFSFPSWIKNYIGYKVTFVPETRAAELARTEAAKAMPCWPNQGSIQIIENTVVIKCQELS